jgi:hypothetical protein
VHAGGTTLFVTVVTMTREQAVCAVEITARRGAIPMHDNDFSVLRSWLAETHQFQPTAVSATRRRRCTDVL